VWTPGARPPPKRPRADAAADGDAGSPGGDLHALLAPPPSDQALPPPQALTGDAAHIPLLRLLAGNPVTAAAVWTALGMEGARQVRRVHPVLRDALASVPWWEPGARIYLSAVAAWRAAYPAARACTIRRVSYLDGECEPTDVVVRALGLLDGLEAVALCCTSLEEYIAIVPALPPSLRTLHIWDGKLGGHIEAAASSVSFAHLTRLEVLTAFRLLTPSAVATLPPNIMNLHAEKCELGSLAHLPHLRVLRVVGGRLDAATLPRSVVALEGTVVLSMSAPLTQFTSLRVFSMFHHLGEVTVSALPPWLEALDADCEGLPFGQMYDHLPALRRLRCRGMMTAAQVATLPRTLEELHVNGVLDASALAVLADRLVNLRYFWSLSLLASPELLAPLFARGCAVAVCCGHLHGYKQVVVAGDGRAALCDWRHEVSVYRFSGPTVVRQEYCIMPHAAAREHTQAVVLLPAGITVAMYRIDSQPLHSAVGTRLVCRGVDGRERELACPSGAVALAAVPPAQVAVGYGSGVVRVVDAVSCTVVRTLRLELYGRRLVALAYSSIAGGTLVAALTDGAIRLVQVAHPHSSRFLHDRSVSATVATMAIRADGTCVVWGPTNDLASHTGDVGTSIQLWDLERGACTCMLHVPADYVRPDAMLPLPDGRIAVAAGSTVELWDPDHGGGCTAALPMTHGVCAIMPVPIPDPDSILVLTTASMFHLRLPPRTCAHTSTAAADSWWRNPRWMR